MGRKEEKKKQILERAIK